MAINFYYQTKFEENSHDHTMVNYIKKKGKMLTQKDILWKSAKAHWLTIAMIESGQYSKEVIQRCAISSCFLLENQKNYICSATNLQLAQFPNLIIPPTQVSEDVSTLAGESQLRGMSQDAIEEANQVFEI